MRASDMSTRMDNRLPNGIPSVVGRRGFLKSAGAAAILAGGGCVCPCGGKPLCEYDDELIDRCWLWGHETGQVDRPGNGWKLDAAKSYYHMADAAKFMGLHNLNVIRWDKPPKAFRDSLRGLKRVTWPTKRKLIVYSVIVLVFMLFMGILIGLFDLGASALVRALGSVAS